MKRNNHFDFLRQWANKLADQYRSREGVEVEVIEPRHPNGALTVNVDFSRTLAQVVLWVTGMLELRVIAIESGAEVATESHELKEGRELSEILQHVETLVQETQVGK